MRSGVRRHFGGQQGGRSRERARVGEEKAYARVRRRDVKGEGAKGKEKVKKKIRLSTKGKREEREEQEEEEFRDARSNTYRGSSIPFRSIHHTLMNGTHCSSLKNNLFS